MTKPKTIFTTAAFFIVCLLTLTNTFAQTDPKQTTEASYEIVLQILTASDNKIDKSSVPPVLSNVVKKLKTIYSFSDYRLDSTFFERVANSGSVESKSIANISLQNQELYAPTFSEWTLTGLRSFSDSSRQNSIQFQSFRFGQRIPVKTHPGAVDYEQIGMSIQRFSLSENVPTIIGSLSTAKPDEQMFFILTVKPTQE